MEVKVKDRQSLLDMAVQTSGSMEAAFDLAVRNGISLTDELKDDQVLNSVFIRDTEVVRRYKVQGLCPATDLSEEEVTSISQEGINFMGIEIDFVVS